MEHELLKSINNEPGAMLDLMTGKPTLALTPEQKAELQQALNKSRSPVVFLADAESALAAQQPAPESIDGAWDYRERCGKAFWWIKGDSVVFVYGNGTTAYHHEDTAANCRYYIASGQWRRVLPSEMTPEQRKAIGVDEGSIDGDWVEDGYRCVWHVKADSVEVSNGGLRQPAAVGIELAKQSIASGSWRRISPAEIAERQAKARGEHTHVVPAELLKQSEHPSYDAARQDMPKAEKPTLPAPSPEQAAEKTHVPCADCGTTDMPIDTVLIGGQWKLIAGEGVVLCASCIGRRAAKLSRVINLTVGITFADDFCGAAPGGRYFQFLKEQVEGAQGATTSEVSQPATSAVDELVKAAEQAADLIDIAVAWQEYGEKYEVGSSDIDAPLCKLLRSALAAVRAEQAKAKMSGPSHSTQAIIGAIGEVHGWFQCDYQDKRPILDILREMADELAADRKELLAMKAHFAPAKRDAVVAEYMAIPGNYAEDNVSEFADWLDARGFFQTPEGEEEGSGTPRWVIIYRYLGSWCTAGPQDYKSAMAAAEGVRTQGYPVTVLHAEEYELTGGTAFREHIERMEAAAFSSPSAWPPEVLRLRDAAIDVTNSKSSTMIFSVWQNLNKALVVASPILNKPPVGAATPVAPQMPEEVRQTMKDAVICLEHYGPQVKGHSGPCGPDAGCDGECEDWARFCNTLIAMKQLAKSPDPANPGAESADKDGGK